MQRHSQKLKRQLCFSLLALGSTILALGFYSGLRITNYTFLSKNLPSAFYGYRIVFLTDLHCKRFGTKQKKLLNSIYSLKPDIIIFTGDMIDNRHSDLSPICELLSGLSGKYPIYAVHGNHEFDNEKLYQKLMSYYEQYNVHLLNDEQIFINPSGECVSSSFEPCIGISGISYRKHPTGQEICPDRSKADFHLLLYHDALAFPWISELGYDLVLSGHVHAGAIHLPVLGGVFSPEGTFFPIYDYGYFHENESTMLASSGLGDTVIPRFYNRPELILITLSR